jgi:regulator of replication initiation timing
MTEATDTPDSGIDSAEPSDALDNPANLNFGEPEEDQANEEVEQTGTETDSETDAPVEDGQEAEEPADGTETEEGAQPAEVKDDAVVDVAGEKLPISELKAGYQRQADYTRKTQELGNKRRDLEALSTRVTASVDAIADLLVKQIPPAPDASLAMTDPGKYVADKAMHDAMMAQVASVIEQAQAPKEAVNKLTQEQRAELLQSENAKLAEAFPQTMKPETRKKFFDDVSRVANELGYSQQELEGVTDHRMFKLAYYANLGMAAEKAKAKATQKVANVPPMAQQKRQVPAKIRANQDAMKRLAKSGSIHDALDIDFE